MGAPPPGALHGLPNLRLIISLTAGVDGLLRDKDLPAVPLVRAGDASGDMMMNESALLHVLRHHRYLPAYQRAQARREWIKLPIKAAHERKVGVMGLGMIGLAAAKSLAAAGFQVAGWVRQPRPDAGIEIFGDASALRRFSHAARSCSTCCRKHRRQKAFSTGRLCRRSPRGRRSSVAARRARRRSGSDRRARSGHLSAATLDVFPVEPLPNDSPLWSHPKITVMPHVARKLVRVEMAPRVRAIIEDFRAGRPLQLIDRGRGY